MLADYHVHTYYSDDSVYPMKECIKDAIALGVNELCFTEHVDYGIKEDWKEGVPPVYRKGGLGEAEYNPAMNCNYPCYIKEIQQWKEKYKDKITIKMGMEFGMQKDTIPQYEKLFRTYDFDFILLSVHQVDNLEFWTGDFQKGRTQKEYNLRYYEELLYLVEHYTNYSVLAHLDLITRYDPQGPIDFEVIRPIVTKILRQVIQDGKGIEFNTSYHRYHLTDTTPRIEILKLYRQLGGRIITIGSDSHKKEHLAAYIPEAKTILKGLGFSSFYTYEKMQPKAQKII